MRPRRRTTSVHSKNIRMTPAQTALIEAHADLPRIIARWHWRTALGSNQRIDVDDLEADGAVGLVKAARAFKPGTGASFKTFASIRIRGAIIDGLRDWSRADGYTRRNGRVAKRVVLTPRKHDDERDDSYVINGVPNQPDPAPSPEAAAATAQAWRRIERHLSARERAICAALRRDLMQTEIAAELQISNTRMSQLVRGIVAKGACAVAAA